MSSITDVYGDLYTKGFVEEEMLNEIFDFGVAELDSINTTDDIYHYYIDGECNHFEEDIQDKYCLADLDNVISADLRCHKEKSNYYRKVFDGQSWISRYGEIIYSDSEFMENHLKYHPDYFYNSLTAIKELVGQVLSANNEALKNGDDPLFGWEEDTALRSLNNSVEKVDSLLRPDLICEIAQNVSSETLEPKEKTVTALYVCPGKAPEVVEVVDTYDNWKHGVGGWLEVVSPFEDKSVILVCNERGKIPGKDGELLFEPNRCVSINGHNDFIFGNFYIVGENLMTGEFASLTDEQIGFYESRFHYPEKMVYGLSGVESYKYKPENELAEELRNSTFYEARKYIAKQYIVTLALDNNYKIDESAADRITDYYLNNHSRMVSETDQMLAYIDQELFGATILHPLTEAPELPSGPDYEDMWKVYEEVHLENVCADIQSVAEEAGIDLDPVDIESLAKDYLDDYLPNEPEYDQQLALVENREREMGRE